MGKKKNKKNSAKKRKKRNPGSKSKNREALRIDSGEVILNTPIDKLIPEDIDLDMLPKGDNLIDFLEEIIFSSFLIDEPEFHCILFDPDVTLQEFLDVLSENDFDLDELYVLFEEENEEELWIFVHITANRLLNKRIKDEILIRLDDVWLRATDDADIELAVAVSIIREIIDRTESKEILAAIGLIQGLVMKSLLIGLEFSRLMWELEENEKANIFSLQNGENISGLNLDERFAELEECYPGLIEYLNNRFDEEGIWDEGLEALNKGELTLNLFSDKEIVHGIEIFFAANDKLLKVVPDDKEQSEEMIKKFYEIKAVAEEKVREFVDRLINKNRLQKMIKRLNAYLDDADYDEWFAFLMMFKEYLTQREPEDIRQLSFELFMTEVRQAIKNRDLPIFKDRPIDLSYWD